MKKGPTIFLQILIVLIGIGVLIAMLWEPHFEGRNVNATFFEIYFNDPFLACVYIGSIPFFVALWQAFKLLGHARNDMIFSQASLKAVRTIKYCAFMTAAAIVAVDIYIRIAALSSNDDPAGALALGIGATFVSIIIGTAASVFEGILKNARAAN